MADIIQGSQTRQTNGRMLGRGKMDGVARTNDYIFVLPHFLTFLFTVNQYQLPEAQNHNSNNNKSRQHLKICRLMNKKKTTKNKNNCKKQHTHEM